MPGFLNLAISFATLTAAKDNDFSSIVPSQMTKSPLIMRLKGRRSILLENSASNLSDFKMLPAKSKSNSFRVFIYERTLAVSSLRPQDQKIFPA